MELKLSSNKIIPDAYLATYVPAIPIANPISAFLRAGASFVPSPVIATTFPSCFKPVAMRYLSSGEDLAKTLKLSATFVKFSKFPTVYTALSPSPSVTNPPTNSLKTFPSITVVSISYVSGCQSASKMPAYLAIAIAVFLLSPVTILTLTPALAQTSTAFLIPSLRGSLIPTIPMIIRSFSISSHSSGA